MKPGDKFTLEDGTPILVVKELDANNWCGCEGCVGANNKVKEEYPKGLKPLGICAQLPGGCTSKSNEHGVALIYIRSADLVAYLEASNLLGEST